MPQTVGVVCVQGDYEKHFNALKRLNLHLAMVEVRTIEQLEGVDRLIIPGGESTTVGLLMQRYGLGEAIQKRAAEGMPVWGTCMGMIMMAREVEGREQYTLDLLDITVRRNAFGAQIHSFEDEVPMEGLETPAMGVFIRAPIVTRIGEGVEVLGRYEDQIVAVKQDRRLGTSFHPELTEDSRIHQLFLNL